MTLEAQTRYGIIKAKTSLPVTDLLVVPHRERDLIVRYPAFGRNSYSGNLETIRRTEFYHSDEVPRVRFRPATTSESISAAAYNFIKLAKPEIFDPSLLQLGWVVRTSEGVFANPPRDAEGDPIANEAELKAYLDNCRKVNGIYLGVNDFGFAPYEAFKIGFQDNADFAEGGLARVLEHSDKKTALNLRDISSSENYPNEVNVCWFDPVDEPVIRVSTLVSFRGFGGGLLVDGGDYGSGDGYAFGVQNTGEASRTEK